MPRSRMIKPEFWDDEKLSTISIESRFIFIGLWTFSDDYGVVKGNPVWLKNHILPYEDSVSPQEFKRWLTELEKQRCIFPFSHNVETFYFIRTFNDHQTINRPSKQRNPIPPKDILNDLRNTHGALTDETETEVNTETETEVKYKPLNYFDFFWDKYNKKVDRKKCEDKFSKLNESDVNKILESVDSYVLANNDQTYRKNPLTYLNGECWNDEIIFKQIKNNNKSVSEQNTQTCQEWVNGK